MATVHSEIFARILFSRKALKMHICVIKNSRLWHKVPISFNVKVISSFREGLFLRKFAYAYAKFREIKASRKFPNLHSIQQRILSILFTGFDVI